MQPTTWVRWALDEMRDAADYEGLAGLSAFAVPGHRGVESLPYYGAFADYRAHVTACAPCRDDGRPDCAEGETLLEVSRIGVAEQHCMAALN